MSDPAPHSRNPEQPDERLVESSHDTFMERLTGGRGRKYVRFVMAALGSIPWVGGVIAAGASFSAERDQEKISDLQRLWLEEHKEKVRELGATLNDIFERLDSMGPEIQERIESPEYCAFRAS